MVVVTSRYLERTPKIANRLLVKWLRLEMSEINKTSGGTLAILESLDLDIMSKLPSGVKMDFCLKK